MRANFHCSVYDPILKRGSKWTSGLRLIRGVNMPRWHKRVEQFSETKAGVTGPWDKSGIMIFYPCQCGSSLKSHLERFSGPTGLCTVHSYQRSSKTHPLPSAAGESILSTLHPLSGCINSTEPSVVGRCHLTGFGDFNSGPDFNRFSLRKWFPVVMRDANALQQPCFSHLSSW